jgi:hypothetical protein
MQQKTIKSKQGSNGGNNFKLSFKLPPNSKSIDLWNPQIGHSKPKMLLNAHGSKNITVSMATFIGIKIYSSGYLTCHVK